MALARVKHDQKAREREQSTPSDSTRALPQFSETHENELGVLKIAKWAIQARPALIKECDKCFSVFILAGVYLAVTVGNKKVSVLAAGDCFGEMSYLAHKDAPHRSATVTTTSDCIVLKIRAEDLRASSLSCRRLFDERFLNTLVDRLEKANQQLAVMS